MVSWCVARGNGGSGQKNGRAEARTALLYASNFNQPSTLHFNVSLIGEIATDSFSGRRWGHFQGGPGGEEATTARTMAGCMLILGAWQCSDGHALSSSSGRA